MSKLLVDYLKSRDVVKDKQFKNMYRLFSFALIVILFIGITAIAIKLGVLGDC